MRRPASSWFARASTSPAKLRMVLGAGRRSCRAGFAACPRHPRRVALSKAGGEAFDFCAAEHLAFEPAAVDGELEAACAQVLGESFTGAMGSPKPMARAVGPVSSSAISGRPAPSRPSQGERVLDDLHFDVRRAKSAAKVGELGDGEATVVGADSDRGTLHAVLDLSEHRDFPWGRHRLPPGWMGLRCT